jgi:hypothetical protein
MHLVRKRTRKRAGGQRHGRGSRKCCRVPRNGPNAQLAISSTTPTTGHDERRRDHAGDDLGHRNAPCGLARADDRAYEPAPAETCVQAVGTAPSEEGRSCPPHAAGPTFTMAKVKYYIPSLAWMPNYSLSLWVSRLVLVEAPELKERHLQTRGRRPGGPDGCVHAHPAVCVLCISARQAQPAHRPRGCSPAIFTTAC